MSPGDFESLLPARKVAVSCSLSWRQCSNRRQWRRYRMEPLHVKSAVSADTESPLPGAPSGSRRCRQRSRTSPGPISALASIRVPSNRAACRARAASTRWRMASEGSPSRSSDSFSSTRRVASTRGTSMWMSIRSNNGPEIRRMSCIRLVAADHGVAARALLHRVPIIAAGARVHRADKHKVFTTDPRRFLFLLCLSWQARPICDTIRRPISSSGVKIRINTRVNYDIIWRIAALQCSVAVQQPLGCNALKLRNPNDSIPSLLKSTGEAIRKSALHLKGEA
jgi:hypothetical protein